METYLIFDSFDNYNKSRNSGISSAVKSSELSKDGKSPSIITHSQPKSKLLHNKYRSTHSLDMWKSHESEQKSRKNKFAERQSTFLSLSKRNTSSKNGHVTDLVSHQKILFNHRKTEERRSFLIHRGRSIEKITNPNPTARIPRAANSLDKNADLLAWELAPESFKGMDFDTYIPTRKLGAGAHGSAYEVLHKSGQNIVTKFFRKEQKRFFRHEAAVLAQLKKISELLTNNTFEFDIEPHFEIDDYYCLNLVAGMGTLDDFIDFLYKEKKTLNEQELLFIFEKLFESYLNFVKLNYAHRDIKPGNIILDPKDLTPKFIDYSLAACSGGTNKITRIAGTRPYISPFLEQFTKWGLISADLYSLGVTILEVTFPDLDIISQNHKAKEKLVKRKFKAMPILRKVLRTLLSDSKKKFNILRKIYKQKELLKNEVFEKLFEESKSDDEEAIDNFKFSQNGNSPLAGKYLQDFIKFLKPNHNYFKEDEKDGHKTADTPKKNYELFFQEEELEYPLSLARKAVELFNSDPQSKNVNEVDSLLEEIKKCLLGLDNEKAEEKKYQQILLNDLAFLSEKYVIESKCDQLF